MLFVSAPQLKYFALKVLARLCHEIKKIFLDSFYLYAAALQNTIFSLASM